VIGINAVADVTNFAPGFTYGPAAVHACLRGGHVASRRGGREIAAVRNAPAHRRRLYEFASDSPVERVGFLHPTITFAGASPDGLVGGEGLVEIKCPLTATHIASLVGEASAAKYVTQMQWWCLLGTLRHTHG
jgi:hypothetical protein